MNINIPCVHFNFKDYETILRNNKKEDDRALIALFKILSPQHFFKVSAPNDSNSLNEKFYKELLHIIGLEEAKEGGKNIIRRKKENRNTASLLEMALSKLHTKGIHKIRDLQLYGDTLEDQHFNIALELCIGWVNRILFLKLLEGQLMTYHNGSGDYRFLHSKMVHDFDELFKLFHSVLAVSVGKRDSDTKEKYKFVPYLNSSLFEISYLEDVTICIDSLDNSNLLPLIGTTILTDTKIQTDKLPSLDYLFRFLDAYDFASEGNEDIQEDNKTIINASVLGKVFEKINGYKDGSIFTPAFITMYMCRQSIRLAVVEKFNEAKGWNLHSYHEIYNKIEDKKEANQIINSLKICDPAVGSGHFLVSALNEIICIKSELGILMDENGKTLRDYKAEVIDDELYVYDIETEKQFYYLKPEAKSNRVSYQFGGGEINAVGISHSERQRIQETLFHEKQTIIENCLFGVDINPNSVKICRLRLWIELLKNAYYKKESGFTELETLPNIDINIKCGNSLLSRFALDADLSDAFKSIQYDIKAYRGFVQDYKNEKSREVKRGLEIIITSIKDKFREQFYVRSKENKDLQNIRGQYLTLMTSNADLFGKKLKGKDFELQKEKLENRLSFFQAKVDDIKNNLLYKNAFEWRFEFPEVMNNDGSFEGFDLIIGNPPYIRQEEIKNLKGHLLNNYKTYSSTADLYVYFVEKSFDILKPTGNTTLIIPNKWMQAGYGKGMRSFLLNKQLFSIVDFGDFQVFDNVTTYPCILHASKIKSENIFQSSVVKTLQNNKDFEAYINSIAKPIDSNELTEGNWMISSGTEQNLLSKVTLASVSLSEYINENSFRGVLTGLSEAFLIDTKTKDQLIEEDTNSERLIKPFLQGRNIKPYAIPQTDSWLILIPKGFTIKRNLPTDNPFYLAEPMARYGDMPYDDAWEWFKKSYPAIAKHLFPFKAKAEKRTDKGDYWWELRACDYYDEFEKPKIMYQVLQVKPCFIYDDTNQFCNNSMWIIPKGDKCLVGILNSKMGWWLISKYCSAIQNGFQLIWKYFGQIPIPTISESHQKQMIALVDKTISLKQQGKDSSAKEQQIDQLVYQLYNLTADEIKTVEGK